MATIANYSKMTSGGEAYYAQNANKSWSLNTDSDNAYRFELRSGDQWVNDGSAVERSQLKGADTIPFGQTQYVNFDIMLESNPQASTASWVSLAGWHATEDAGESGSQGMMTLHMHKGNFYLISRSNPDAITSRPAEVVQLNRPIEQGKWYNFVFETQFERNGNGHLKVWLNGEKVVDYVGAIGFNDQVGPYFKYGLYRSEAAEPLVAKFKNIDQSSTPLTPGTSEPVSQPSDETPAPAPTAPTPTAPTPTTDSSLQGTDGNDTILGGSGDDVISGNAGDDLVNGKAGNDTVLGELGNDKLHGWSGNDIINGGSGNDIVIGGGGQDKLTGGTGADVFDFNGFGESLGSAADTIIDFEHLVDKIDLYGMDANWTQSGNQDFRFIGSNSFSGQAGQLRYSDSMLSGDLNGDKVADFSIKVSNATITSVDLIL